ncbi:MAG TPA: hypothetical protein VF131_17465 [Blastocatellia bacterium]|nr:hypothetical protein [Blastocatellia bacterium]
MKRIDTGDSTAEPPVVLVVLGSTSEGAVVATEKPDCGNQISHASSGRHPGLERFPLAEPRAADVPKYCFMEPDRVCVNSGACEMLGN